MFHNALYEIGSRLLIIFYCICSLMYDIALRYVSKKKVFFLSGYITERLNFYRLMPYIQYFARKKIISKLCVYILHTCTHKKNKKA